MDAKFIIQTDASGVELGCVLMQKYEGVNHPVAYRLLVCLSHCLLAFLSAYLPAFLP